MVDKNKALHVIAATLIVRMDGCPWANAATKSSD
jgi:hypothetical protein